MSLLSQFVPGGIKSIQRGVITLTSATATATISAVDTSKSFISFLGFTTNSDSLSRGTVRLSLASATSVTAIKTSAPDNATVSYEVVEFY